MALSAVQSLEDAFEATKQLLLPFEAGRWVRIAILAFFVGSLGTPPFGGDLTVDAGGAGPDVVPHVPPGGGVIVLVLAVLAAIVGLVFLYVGSVMEFVLVETLRTRDATVRERFAAYRWQGTRLFAFRLGLFVLTALLVGGAFGLGVLLGGPGLLPIGLLFAILVALFVLPVVAVVHGFTTVFVVPVMLAERCGVLEGWRRFRPAVGDHLDEYGLYLLLSVVASWLGGAFVATVAAIVGAVVLLPIGAAALFAWLSGSLQGLVLVVLVPVLVVAVLVALAVAAVVRVPVLAFLRYYALFVLGDTTEYDLVAAVRADVRGGEDDGDDGDGPSGTPVPPGTA